MSFQLSSEVDRVLYCTQFFGECTARRRTRVQDVATEGLNFYYTAENDMAVWHLLVGKSLMSVYKLVKVKTG